jgi:hypothetical protein
MTEVAAQKVETEQDFGDDTGAEARRWLAEIKSAEGGDVASYITRCRAIERRYKDERDGLDDRQRRYARPRRHPAPQGPQSGCPHRQRDPRAHPDVQPRQL